MAGTRSSAGAGVEAGPSDCIQRVRDEDSMQHGT